MGVRAALGATRARILKLILSEGLSRVGWGLAVGLAASALLTRLMQGMLYGVEPLDPVVFAVAPVVLLAIAVLACLVPARRATAVDPAGALRSD
jgi:ABC-type antimicrobial peptide transport system permease subunit